jgi:hypothetical protein
LPNTLTEYDAAIAYAEAWNTLDCTRFIRLLASDAEYASQYTYSEINGRDDIAKHICEKFKACVRDDSRIEAVVSIATKISPGKSCVLLIQEGDNVVVVFETRENEIFRINLCVTEIYGPLPLSADEPSTHTSVYFKLPSLTLEERLGALSQMHTNMIAQSGKPASAYCWSNDIGAINMLRKKLETGCARAMVAKTENADSSKRIEALDLYIEACKQVSIALDQVTSALGCIEDSV